MEIPSTIKHDDLMAALKPLHDLLGITPMHVYADPPMMIGGKGGVTGLGTITFSVVASDDDGTEFPKGLPVSSHPQGNDAEEWRHFITVEIV